MSQYSIVLETSKQGFNPCFHFVAKIKALKSKDFILASVCVFAYFIQISIVMIDSIIGGEIIKI